MTSRRPTTPSVATVIAASLAAALTLAACTSEMSTDLSLDPTPTTTTTSTSATDPTTAPTKTPATTATPTTAAPLTAEPTTTMSAPALTDTDITVAPTVEEQISADFGVMMAARILCGQDPVNCDFATAALTDSPADIATRDRAAADITDNLRAVPGQGEYKWRIDSIDAAPDVANVTTCVFDTAIVFDIADPANPNDDTVVNDLKASTIIRWEMRLVDGRWALYASERLERLEGADLCGFA